LLDKSTSENICNIIDQAGFFVNARAWPELTASKDRRNYPAGRRSLSGEMPGEDSLISHELADGIVRSRRHKQGN